jgi:hypothetical protein
MDADNWRGTQAGLSDLLWACRLRALCCASYGPAPGKRRYAFLPCRGSGFHSLMSAGKWWSGCHSGRVPASSGGAKIASLAALVRDPEWYGRLRIVRSSSQHHRRPRTITTACRSCRANRSWKHAERRWSFRAARRPTPPTVQTWSPVVPSLPLTNLVGGLIVRVCMLNGPHDPRSDAHDSGLLRGLRDPNRPPVAQREGLRYPTSSRSPNASTTNVTSPAPNAASSGCASYHGWGAATG